MSEKTPRSVAGINASTEQKILRHVGRIKTIRAWLEQAKTRKGDRKPKADKVKAMQAELDRRLGELTELRATIDEALDAV